MLDIRCMMTRLAERQLVFHSEADFQHALAWQIHETMPERQVRLEVNVIPTERRGMFLDILLPQEGIAIELKYVTRKLEIDQGGELFHLRDHGAQDQRRYDFLLDIQRLETTLLRRKEFKAGGAVLLTNDPLYWRKSGKANAVDLDFHLHEGRRVAGELKWSDGASLGTKRGRESPILLKNSYNLHWHRFSQLNVSRYGEFRYLAVSVVQSRLAT